MSVLDKQMAELRRRLNTTGDLSHRAIRPAWSHKLRLDLAGQPERNEANVITALSCDEAFAGAIVFDEFRQEIVVDPAACRGTRRRAARPVRGPTATTCARAEWLQRRELERDADDREPQRRRRGARDHRASGARPSRRARLGRRAAHRDLGLPLPRRRGHRVQPQRRRALADLGRRPHLPARRQGRPHAGARGSAGRAEVHRA